MIRKEGTKEVRKDAGGDTRAPSRAGEDTRAPSRAGEDTRAPSRAGEDTRAPSSAPAAVFNLLCPFQLRWLRESAPLAIAEKSRRIGWTWTQALGVVLDRLDGKGNYYHSSADDTASIEFVDYCAEWARMVNAVATISDESEVVEDREIHRKVITFANGRKIVAGSSNPTFMRSKGGAVGLDEFAFHRDGRALYKAAHATAMFWGYPLRIWSTHNGEACYFNQLITEARAGRLKAAVHRVTILDAVEEGIVERIIMRKKKLDYVPAPDAKARQEWLDELRATCADEGSWNEEYMCVAQTDATAYLSYDLIRQALADNLQLYRSPADLPPGKLYYAGFDVGRRHDLSVAWVLEKVGDVYWTRLLRCLDRQKFSTQEALIDAIMAQRSVQRMCIDETGLGMQLAERARDRWGSRVEGVTLSGPVKHSLGEAFKGLFSDHLIRIPRAVDWEAPIDADKAPGARNLRDNWLVEDLHKTRKIITAAGNVRLAADSDADGHADGFWAGALAREAAEVAKAPLPPPMASVPVSWGL